MNEQLITFETAKLAKEKGFDEIVNNAFIRNIEDRYVEVDDLPERNSELADYNYMRPSQCQLQKWLREKHNIHIEPKWLGNIFYLELNSPIYGHYNLGNNFRTYEEALEKGLYEALNYINDEND